MDQWLSPDFWQGIISQTLAWLVTTLPSLLVILILAFLLLKGANIFLHRMRPLMLKHMENGTDLDTI